MMCQRVTKCSTERYSYFTKLLSISVKSFNLLLDVSGSSFVEQRIFGVLAPCESLIQ